MNAPTPIVVHGQAGAVIELPLSQPPATGHTWQLELPDGVVRAPDGPGRPGGQLGDAAGGAVRVIAIAGQHRLTARLARPWDPPMAAIKTVIIDLVVA